MVGEYTVDEEGVLDEEEVCWLSAAVLQKSGLQRSWKPKQSY